MTTLARPSRKSDQHRQGIREVTPAPAIKPMLSLRNIESEAKQGEIRRRKAPARRQRGARPLLATLRMKKRQSSKEVPEADQAEAEVAELEEAEARQDARRVRETIKNLTNPARTQVTLRKGLEKEEEARISNLRSSSTTKCTLGRRHEGKPVRPQRMARSAWPSPLKLPEARTQLMERSEKIKNSYCPKQRAKRMTRTRPRTSDAARNYAPAASNRPASRWRNQ